MEKSYLCSSTFIKKKKDIKVEISGPASPPYLDRATTVLEKMAVNGSFSTKSLSQIFGKNNK